MSITKSELDQGMYNLCQDIIDMPGSSTLTRGQLNTKYLNQYEKLSKKYKNLFELILANKQNPNHALIDLTQIRESIYSSLIGTKNSVEGIIHLHGLPSIEMNDLNTRDRISHALENPDRIIDSYTVNELGKRTHHLENTLELARLGDMIDDEYVFHDYLGIDDDHIIYSHKGFFQGGLYYTLGTGAMSDVTPVSKYFPHTMKNIDMQNHKIRLKV